MSTPFSASELLAQILPEPLPSVPALNTLFTPRSLKKGEQWLRPGQVCQKIAFIRSGMLRAYVETEEASQTRWAFLPEEFFTSVSSFGLQRPSEEYIEAIEDSELMEIGYQDWEQLCQQIPRLRDFWAQTILDLCGCYERRLHSILIGGAEGRYRYFMEHYPEFVLRVPQKYVAEMLGIAPRHLSRIRREMMERKIQE